MPDPAAQLRYAIERGEYTRALALWEQWSADLATQLKAGTLDPAEWTRAADLYHWGRDLLLAERTHLLNRLNTLHAAGAYGPPAAPTNPAIVRGIF